MHPIILFLVILFGVLASLVVAKKLFRWTQQSHLNKRAELIATYRFPNSLNQHIIERYPHLTNQALSEIEDGLRYFFLAHLYSKRKFISMPSQIVDVLWHEFILHTESYEHFCQSSFGHFLHHKPASELGNNDKIDDGLARTWYQVCRLEEIDPAAPSQLPLLFALDEKLAIPDGFYYTVERGKDVIVHIDDKKFYRVSALRRTKKDHETSNWGNTNSGCGGSSSYDSGSPSSCDSGPSCDSSSGCSSGCGGGGD